MKKDIEEVEGLVGALQEVLGKQAGLIKNIISSNSSVVSKQRGVERGHSNTESSRNTKESSSLNTAAAAAAASTPENRMRIDSFAKIIGGAAGDVEKVGVAEVKNTASMTGTDEWGRPQQQGKIDDDAVQVQKNKDGSVSFSF